MTNSTRLQALQFGHLHQPLGVLKSHTNPACLPARAIFILIIGELHPPSWGLRPVYISAVWVQPKYVVEALGRSVPRLDFAF